MKYIDENGKWYYFRKDHLGNNREVWRFTPSFGGGQGEVVQTNNYYPSGLLWYEAASLSKSMKSFLPYLQPYKYNGKEYIEDFGYDCYAYGFRDYYATIGRFTSIDPMAESSYSKSAYAYASNNFAGEIDFMGLFSCSTSTQPTFPVPTGGDNWGGILGSDDFGSLQDILDKIMGNKGSGGVLGGMLGGGGNGFANLAGIFEAYVNGNISEETMFNIYMSSLNSGNLLDKSNFVLRQNPTPEDVAEKAFDLKELYDEVKAALKGDKTARLKLSTRFLEATKVISKKTAKKTLGVLSISDDLETLEEWMPAINESLGNEYKDEQIWEEVRDGERIKKNISRFWQDFKNAVGIGDPVYYDPYGNPYVSKKRF